MATTADYNRKGLIKLMLRLPALRGRLQISSLRNPDIAGLCGAFEEASATLERLRKENLKSNVAKIAEYERLCQEIEDEIIAML